MGSWVVNLPHSSLLHTKCLYGPCTGSSLLRVYLLPFHLLQASAGQIYTLAHHELSVHADVSHVWFLCLQHLFKSGQLFDHFDHGTIKKWFNIWPPSCNPISTSRHLCPCEDPMKSVECYLDVRVWIHKSDCMIGVWVTKQHSLNCASSSYLFACFL